MILRELIRQISERISQIQEVGAPQRGRIHEENKARGAGFRHAGVRRTRLLVGFALCAAALFVLVGCIDTPEPPLITLTGDALIVVAIGDTFTDEGAIATDNNDPAYGSVMATPAITGSGSTINTATAGVYTITYTAPADADGLKPVAVTRTVRVGIDADTNNHIDINFLEDLNRVRHNLVGDSYRISAGDANMLCGDTGNEECKGYELIRDLDFADGDSYTSGTMNPVWRPNATDPDWATNPGWEPIGAGTGAFSGTFSGNGFAISNLYIRRSGELGLFGASSGTIQRIGVVDVNIYGGAGSDTIGGLVGRNLGIVTASYVTGNVDGRMGNDTIGGLVGNNTSIITASYTTGIVDGEGGDDRVGGLVGNNSGSGSSVTATYTTGNANGGEDNDNVGGLVGLNNTDNSVTASYTTGVVDGEGGSDEVGSVIGDNNGTATANYGFGTVTGEIVTMPRSDDASNTTIVANPCALTRDNSSTMAGNRWDAAQWNFGNATQHPLVQFGGALIPGQTNRGC